MTDVAVMLLG